MTDPQTAIERFLSRWSRRKRSAERASDAASHDSRPAFDAACLPPIESIQAASDIRDFLAPGIPVELARTALRRAWVADPTIRDFIGIAENQWDFTKPDGVPGFGPLNLTPELHNLISQLIGDGPQHRLTRQSEVPAGCASGNAGETVTDQGSNDPEVAATNEEKPPG